MDKAIVLLTELKTLPASCNECLVVECTVPVQKRRPDKLMKSCITKRHKYCPLRVVDQKDLEGVT